MDEQTPTGPKILDGHEGNTSASQLAIPAAPSTTSAALDGVASTKVFGIMELAGLILKSLPVQARARLRRVSRSWDSIISKIGCAVEPTFRSEHNRDSWGSLSTHEDSLVYKVDFALHFHPAINSSTDNPSSRTNSIKEVKIKVVADFSKLHARQQEFITWPPITTVRLNLEKVLHYHSYRMAVRRAPAILEERTGLRIVHLLDAFNKMLVQADEDRLLSSESHPGEPIAHIQWCGPELVTFTSGKRASTKVTFSSAIKSTHAAGNDVMVEDVDREGQRFVHENGGHGRDEVAEGYNDEHGGEEGPREDHVTLQTIRAVYGGTDQGSQQDRLMAWMQSAEHE